MAPMRWFGGGPIVLLAWTRRPRPFAKRLGIDRFGPDSAIIPHIPSPVSGHSHELRCHAQPGGPSLPAPADPRKFPCCPAPRPLDKCWARSPDATRKVCRQMRKHVNLPPLGAHQRQPGAALL
jgi:hypothetical protein